MLEVRASSPQRIHLRVYTRGGAPGGALQPRPLPPVPGRLAARRHPGVAAGAASGDRATTWPPSATARASGYFLGLWGPFVPLTDVEAIGFEMEQPDRLADAGGARRSAWRRSPPATRCSTACPSWTSSGSPCTTRGPGRPAPSRTCGGVAGRGARARPRRLRPLPLRRLRRHEGGGHGLLPRREEGRPLVVRRPRRPPLPLARGRRHPAGDGRRPPRVARPSSASVPPQAVLPARERDGDRGVSFLSWNLLRRFGERLDRRLDRPDAAPDGRVGPEHGRQLERREAVGGEAQALRDPARELADRGELPRPSRRATPTRSRRRPTSGRAGSARRGATTPGCSATSPPTSRPSRRRSCRRWSSILAGPADGDAGGAREVARRRGHRGAAEGVRRRRVRPLRRDHERGGEAARPEPPQPRDAQRGTADRGRDPRRARLRRLQRQHLRRRGAGRRG